MAESAREAVLSVMANIFDEDFSKRFGKYKSSRSQMFFKISVLKILQISQENTGLGPGPLLKMVLPQRIAKFLITTFFTEQLWLLLLEMVLAKSNISTAAGF